MVITGYYWSMVIRRDEYLVTVPRDLGAAFKHFRSAAGVTQVEAAEAMGIGQPYLSALERGKFGSSLTHVLRLLRFVGCEVVVRPRGGSPEASGYERVFAAIREQTERIGRDGH